MVKLRGKSTVSLHFEKHKTGSTGLQRHNERVPGQNHSNKNIDASRTADNIFLVKKQGSYANRINDVIKNEYTGKKAVRKDAVRMISATVQLGGDIVEKRTEAEQIEVLKEAFEELKERYGEKNIISAVIHVDETTPHLHFDFVPITKDGKLSAKTVLGDKNKLRKTQKEFMDKLSDRTQVWFGRKENQDLNGLKQEQFEFVQAKLKEVDKVHEALLEEQNELWEEQERFEKQKEQLASEKDELEKRENDLLSQKNRFEGDKRKSEAELSLKRKNLSEAIFEANNRVSQIKVFEKNVKSRENAILEREQALFDREKAVEKRENHLSNLRQALSADEKKVSEREKNVFLREKKVERNEQSLNAKRELVELNERRATEKMDEAKRMAEQAKAVRDENFGILEGNKKVLAENQRTLKKNERILARLEEFRNDMLESFDLVKSRVSYWFNKSRQERKEPKWRDETTKLLDKTDEKLRSEEFLDGENIKSALADLMSEYDNGMSL